MGRRKRMHGKKRRSPAKLSMMNPNPNGQNTGVAGPQVLPDTTQATTFAKPTGEGATSYNPRSIQNHYKRQSQLFGYLSKMRNKLKGSQEEEGAHSHDDDGIQSKNPYKQQSKIFGSGSGGRPQQDPRGGYVGGTIGRPMSALAKAFAANSGDYVKRGGGFGGNKHSNPGNNWGRGGSIGGQGDQSYPGRTPFAKKSPSKKSGFKMKK